MSLYHILMSDYLRKRGKSSTLEDPERLHLFSDRSHKKTLGERYLEALDAGGDIEEVTRKFIDLGTRQPGATKANVKRYLDNYLEKSRESGRLQIGG